MVVKIDDWAPRELLPDGIQSTPVEYQAYFGRINREIEL